MLLPSRVPRKRVPRKTQAGPLQMDTWDHVVTSSQRRLLLIRIFPFYLFTFSFLWGLITGCKLHLDTLILNILKGFLWSTLYPRIIGIFSACFRWELGQFPVRSACEWRRLCPFLDSPCPSRDVLTPYHSEVEPKKSDFILETSCQTLKSPNLRLGGSDGQLQRGSVLPWQYWSHCWVFSTFLGSRQVSK